MNRQILVKLISEMLRKKFSLSTIQGINRRLAQGEFMNVFPAAVDKAILDGIAENWQKEQEGKQAEGRS